jgi:hypothetical protein
MHKAFAYILLAILSFPVGAQLFWQGPVIDEVQVEVPFYPQNTLAWCWVASDQTETAIMNNTRKQTLSRIIFLWMGCFSVIATAGHGYYTLIISLQLVES